jgi:hypothetical protein
VKDAVMQYEGKTLLLSNMVLRLREGRRAENPPETGAGFHGLSPLQIPTDAGYFYFQAVNRVFPRRLLSMTTVSISPRSMKA